MELVKRLSCFIMLFALISCGGGGDLTGNSNNNNNGNNNGNNGGAAPIQIVLSASGDRVSAQSPVTITATVTQDGSAVANRAVSFTLSATNLVIIDPESNSAVTNAQGVATVTLRAGTVAGGVEITANIGDASSTPLGVTSAGDGGVTALQVNLSISSQLINAQSPATITATVARGNTPIANELVTFTLSNSELANFSPESGTSMTNAEGQATIQLNAGGTAGAGQVTAQVGDISSRPVTFTSAGDGNSSNGPQVDDLRIFASSQQLASSDSQAITLTAVAKDNNNNLVSGAEITFSSTTGSIEVTRSTTEANGQATAVLTTPAEPANRVITVTAVNSTNSDSVDIDVVGTSIVLTGSSSLAIGDNTGYIVRLLDSDGTGIANTAVNLSTTDQSTTDPAGAVASITLPDSVTTDATGQATFTAVGASGGTNTITATALGATIAQNVAIQADSFVFTSFNNGDGTVVNPSATPAPTIPEVLLSDSATLRLAWTRNNTAVTNANVRVTTTRGTANSTNLTTNANGEVEVQLSSTQAGRALVTLAGTDNAISLSNQLEFEFVAETVDTIEAQASPNSIGPNQQTSTISVVVRDASGNLVKNKTIDFSLTDTSGGTIFPASAVTDSNGAASTVYTSNSVSAQNGVIITATVNEDPSRSATVNLTVAERELFIALGTGNSLMQLDPTTYRKQYSVFVTDADSNPVDNQVVTISAIPERYYKGQWVKVFDDGEFVNWAANYSTPAGCDNEDQNTDGILDVGEDTNGDGRLTPGNVVAATADVTTDSNGRAVINIDYAESFAQWVDIRLVASAQVQGTENQQQTIFTLPVLAADVANEDQEPPTAAIGLSGPFGIASLCNNPN
ncbi:Ig-like domain-containing protein [Endozoicomonas sp. G2_1]|uniref:beta strand repeat-containing protein n=1 Tax=Endozoicomonas sp. G2_1 TaxID=2821091 RepID=UPI001AD9AF4D|nr:Ig-like domain-containing protein [Endozoicomonas sp. G2_1]MBO9490704.1 Ig-like domain-containing protein [Endozoicomonas sp. G2_1]